MRLIVLSYFLFDESERQREVFIFVFKKQCICRRGTCVLRTEVLLGSLLVYRLESLLLVVILASATDDEKITSSVFISACMTATVFQKEGSERISKRLSVQRYLSTICRFILRCAHINAVWDARNRAEVSRRFGASSHVS